MSELNQPEDAGRGNPVGSPLPLNDLQRLWMQRAQYTQLAPGHEVLGRMVGEWKVKADFDFGGYGPNFQGIGKQTSRMIFNGRFLETRLRVEFAGQVYESLSHTGFDTVIGKFQTVLFDAGTNGMAMLEGDWDEDSQSIREWGEISNPMFRTRHDLALHRRLVSNNRIKVRISVPDMEGKMFDYLTATLQRIEA